MSNKNFDNLNELIQGLALNKVQATKLNKAAGNAMRRVVRANLKNQKDTDGKPFQPRKIQKFNLAKNGKISLNKKMFRGASRSLNQDANADGVSVGYSSVAAKILKIHNEGGKVAFRRGSGKYVAYAMPKREFLGWSDSMTSEVRDSIINEYSKLQGAH
ncbi:phage virion morphogenesis protein [Bathymodiolus septemdierum thioautotrophic gill symbiont]|uniref:Phage tail completion protein n=1 Tax=endosymbiont of Bathymodiolus septemdierum str. Myojin knoll TaxID=1303921 RepID=A0A0N7KBC4_9GAMM|nr:phage virion morphogenesis protein [Bathymodiolus septemdierum thioautotrophic gill symbiont]BAS67623.1 phage tail completion protein [endosymbiont of Bathymodiolus septemdierum str. Myojin knoll]